MLQLINLSPPKFLKRQQKPPPYFFHGAFARSFTLHDVDAPCWTSLAVVRRRLYPPLSSMQIVPLPYNAIPGLYNTGRIAAASVNTIAPVTGIILISLNKRWHYKYKTIRHDNITVR